MSDTLQDLTGIIPETQVVFIENQSTIPFAGMYASNVYHIAPGGRGIVPYFAMCLWLGDPRAVDIDDAHRYRHEEVQRLRVKYGAYDSPEAWDANKPKLAAFDLNNEPIRTVVDDPDGTHLQTKGVNVAQQAAMQTAIATMQAQVARLEAELARVRNEPTPASILNIDAISTDDKAVAPDAIPSTPMSGDSSEGTVHGTQSAVPGGGVTAPDTAAAALAAHAAQALADQIARSQPPIAPQVPADVVAPIPDPTPPVDQTDAEAHAEVVEDTPGVVTITGRR